MDEFLQIDLARVAQRANYHVRADAARPRNISVRILEAHIRGVVSDRNADLLPRRGNYVGVVRPRHRRR